MIKHVWQTLPDLPAVSRYKIRRRGRIFQQIPYYYYSYTYINIYDKRTYIYYISLILSYINLGISS